MTDDGAAGASSSSFPAPWLWASSSLSEGMYDVFLNFRGEDTRFLFTDYLYHGLADVKNLQVFRDDPGLELGDEIKPTLMEAIKRSRIHIVVMSENYVSSSWCLLELEQMLKYSNNGNKRSVIPVFYRVNPAEVRYQISDKSKEAMNKHENREGKDKAEAWKLALSTVCGISGKHIVEKGDQYETGVIGKIAEEVSRKLLEIKQQLNRFDYQFEVVESLLNLESCDTVRVVGIHEDLRGKSYITTFAFELYYKIKYEFRAASFVVDVSKQLRKNTANGLEIVQKELFSDMALETMQELQYKRVLLVLEGVDSKEHLELLEGMGIVDWFGPGSRIIITTENQDIFQNSPVMNGVEIETHCIREGDIIGINRSVKEKNVVGFVKDFIDVINQLREEDSMRRNVVSIVGMGGSGKTTLARMIYDSNEVRKVFPCRAWATVSKDYREKEVFSSLFRSLMSSSTQIPENEEELKSKVRIHLNEKRRKYLVVLDDVWDTQVWNKLKDYLLPKHNNGSRILVTTRNVRVANYAGSKEPHHEPSRLNGEESWELFRSEVFGGEVCPAELEPIGKSIAESCKDLPLAIVTIAGVVAKRKRSETEWKSIENLIPHWCDDDDIDRMKKILKTSYDDLPKNLKPLFLYLGVFPEDYEIKVRELIRLWMAEGFIQVRQTGTSKAPPQPEDIGEDYLKALVDRNLVQVARRSSDGEGVKTCQIHDLFRDLCISESNGNNNARRLSFPVDSYVCSVTCSESQTCSLLFFGKDAEEWSSHVPKNLRVNVLYLSPFTKEVAREEVMEKLIHLRYFRAGAYWDLSNYLCKIEELETLDIYTNRDKGPEINIGQIKQLRHLHCSHEYLTLSQEEGTRDKMQNLQTLSYVHLTPQVEFLLNAGCFPNLISLGLYLFDFGIKEKEHLRSLHCLKYLKKLKLEFYGCRLSLDAIAFPPSLTKIKLSHVNAKELNSEDIHALGRIASLKTLKLYVATCADNLNWGGAGSFPQLRVLHMTRVRLKCLRLGNGSMPRLQRVHIRWCPELKDVDKRVLSLAGNFERVELDPSSWFNIWA
ncbi:disease resistance protein RPP13-like [Arachis stenosperma]|uniref:disease resistance protein RPP13-like n=1 Tax=Arachis stenosperma TaxID=217475 RepID=UPI0025ABD0F0|nr:disease resistance protein RPP13-like [Arachis stenosperma]